jgi:hypothetical protein
MSWDKDALADPIGTRLREIELPPGFDAQDAVRLGRRSKGRRQRVAVLAAVAVTAMVGASAVALRGGQPDPQPLAFPAPVVVDAVAPLRPTQSVECSVIPFEAPTGMYVTGITAVDPTGRFVLSAAWSPGGPVLPVLYRDGVLTRLDETKQWLAVNSSGVVAGIDPPNREGRPRTAYVLRDGVAHRLAVPAGYTMAVPTAINERGDIFGTLLRDHGFDRDGPTDLGYDLDTVVTRGLGVAVWPADSPDSPRLLKAPAEAEAVGFGSGDLMLANLHHDPGSNQTPYAWGPMFARGPLPLPDGWAGFSLRLVQGDFAYGRIVPPNYVADPSLAPHSTQSVNIFLGQWVRWNIRTGKVEVFDREVDLRVANANGWLLLIGSLPDYPAVLVAPDGTSRRIWEWSHIGWISADGKTLIGGAGQGDNRLGRWTCR